MKFALFRKLSHHTGRLEDEGALQANDGMRPVRTWSRSSTSGLVQNLIDVPLQFRSRDTSGQFQAINYAE
jgi:hypothetical protein